MISVVMAVYNGAQYLQQQLDSILNQTLPADEIILVDDGSTDGSIQIAREYENRDRRVQLYTNTHNLGYKRNFHRALQLAQGDIVFLCDQDDAWKPEKIQVMADVLQNNRKIQALASSFTFMDENSQPYSVALRKGRSNNNMYLKQVNQNDLVPVTFEEFCSHNYFQGCALAVTKELKDQFVQNFTDEIPHDWLIGLLASFEQGFYFLNQSLFYYRIHDHNTIGVPKGKKNEEWVRLLFAQDMEKAMTVVKKLFPDYWLYHPDCAARLRFAQNHIQAIQNRSFAVLLRQNFDPHYRELKSGRARAMDLFFVLTHSHYSEKRKSEKEKS